MTKGLEALAGMEYPGRFIIAGRSFDDKYLVVSYGLTGRSSSSKARRFVYEEKTHTVRTDVTNEVELKKGSPALLLYPAIAAHNGAVVVSNGAQTKLLYSALRNISTDYRARMAAEEAMRTPVFEYDSKDGRWIDITTFEPDAPNNTPRISLVAFSSGACFHIVKEKGGDKQEIFHSYELKNGEGKLISTYSGINSNPLPSFSGEPKTVEINGRNPKETNDAIFDSLNPEFRVAVATMYVNSDDVQTSLRSIHD